MRTLESCKLTPGFSPTTSNNKSRDMYIKKGDNTHTHTYFFPYNSSRRFKKYIFLGGVLWVAENLKSLDAQEDVGLLEDDLEESFEEAIGAPKLDDDGNFKKRVTIGRR